MEKRPFFRVAMAGLGKHHMGGYGQIGVYRVNDRRRESLYLKNITLITVKY